MESKRKPYTSVLKKGLRYIEKRKSGEIKSLITPWMGLNKASISGIEWGSIVTVAARPGSGKAQPLTSIIYTPEGPMYMKDIEVGDVICKPNGKTAKVVDVFYQGIKPVYRITLSDGCFVDCCLEHLWKIIVNEKARIVTTKEMIEMLKEGISFHLPELKSTVYFKKRPVKLNPYILGIYLSSNDTSFTNDELSILKYFGLFPIKQSEKFIPEIYKYNSVKMRVDLIKGIINNKKGNIRFKHVSERLILDVREVLQSLGIFPTKKDNELYFHFGDNKYKYTRWIEDVRYDRIEEQKCILINDKEHLYLTDNFAITHNTMFVSQLLREAHRLNPSQKFNILEFQFEMGSEQYAARQFAAETAQDYGIILSAEKELDEFILNSIKNYIEECEEMRNNGIIRDIISEPMSYKEIEQEIKLAYIEGGSRPMITSIDHSWLIKKGISEKDKFDVIYNTTEMLMNLKNQIPIIVLMISQLNRTIEEPSRKTPGTIGNYPTSSDIFGSDALMQGSDIVLVLSRPYKADIKLYGPYGYEVSKDDVFMHVLKMRNSSEENSIIFMKMEGLKQRIIEIPPLNPTRPNGGYVPLSQRTIKNN